MQDNLAYSIEEMQNIYDVIVNYKNNYKNSLDKLLEEIDKLDNCWQTEESKIYDMYKEKFKEKLPELNNISSMLEILASTLQRKINELKDATNSAENIFL